MKLSTTGISKLEELEGFKDVPYRDSGGRWTVGYGHLVRLLDAIPPSSTITKDRADDLLKADVEYTEEAVSRLVTSNVNQNQFDALVLFCYNIGVTNFSSSTLLRLVNLSDFVGAAGEFLKWDKVHTSQGRFIEVVGLKNRREAEKELFETPLSDV